MMAVSGCGSSMPTAPSTAQERKLFRGSPMPPEARRELEESKRQSAAKIAANLSQMKTGPPAGR
jgi:hypothetical protein